MFSWGRDHLNFLNLNNIYFCLRFGLANAIKYYLRLKFLFFECRELLTLNAN